MKINKNFIIGFLTSFGFFAFCTFIKGETAESKNSAEQDLKKINESFALAVSEYRNK